MIESQQTEHFALCNEDQMLRDLVKVKLPRFVALCVLANSNSHPFRQQATRQPSPKAANAAPWQPPMAELSGSFDFSDSEFGSMQSLIQIWNNNAEERTLIEYDDQVSVNGTFCSQQQEPDIARSCQRRATKIHHPLHYC